MLKRTLLAATTLLAGLTATQAPAGTLVVTSGNEVNSYQVNALAPLTINDLRDVELISSAVASVHKRGEKLFAELSELVPDVGGKMTAEDVTVVRVDRDTVKLIQKFSSSYEVGLTVTALEIESGIVMVDARNVVIPGPAATPAGENGSWPVLTECLQILKLSAESGPKRICGDVTFEYQS